MPEFQRFLGDMIETMREYEGVGLAAPQVHISKQVAVIEVEENRRYPGEGKIPLTVLINPKILSASKKQLEDWEGCLSVPGLRGVVPRWARIRYSGFDPLSQPIDREAEGFHARVVQHECVLLPTHC